MAESSRAPLLRRLEFLQVDDFPVAIKRTESEDTYLIREGPRIWAPKYLPCFYKITGIITLTIVIDEVENVWIAFKDVSLELYGFHYAGSGATVEEIEIEDGGS